jgi:hypothetical protein
VYVPGLNVAAVLVSPTVTDAGAVPVVGVAVSQFTPLTVETVTENGRVADVVPDAPMLTAWVAGSAPPVT